MTMASQFPDMMPLFIFLMLTCFSSKFSYWSRPQINIKKNCIEKKNEWGKLKSLPPVNFIFIFALWFSALWNGFKIVQRAFHHGSITFLEINLILNSWNNAVWNFLKKYLVKKIKKKSSTSSYYRKNQQPCIHSDY